VSNKTWAIFAARTVIGRLAHPLPESLRGGGDGRAAALGLLTQELPLADASPFGALPKSVSGESGGSQTAQRGGRMDAPRPALAPPRPAPGVSEPAESTSAHPVFSFRGRGPGARAPEPDGKTISGPKALGSNPARPKPVVDLPPVEVRIPEAARLEAHNLFSEPAAFDNLVSPPQAPPAVRPLSATTQVYELLDSLATELMAVPAPAPSSTGARAGEPEARPGTVFDAYPLPEHAPSTSTQGVPDLPPDPPALWSTASAPTIAHGLRRDTLPGHTASPPALRPVRGGSPSLPLPVDRPALSSLDAETLASMVNEVLAEQARRHGVDLS
jgi:hypothetical protein